MSVGSTWFTSTFLSFLKFPPMKVEGPNFLRGTNSAVGLNYVVPLSVFQFQKFEGLRFFVIHCTSMGSNWFTSTFFNFSKFPQIKRGGTLFLGEKQFYRMAELFGLPFCIWIPDIWRTRILRYSLDFNGCYMIHHDFSQFFEIFSN